MFKAILKVASAPVAIAAVLLVGTEPGRKLTRKVIKETVKTATALVDTAKQLLDNGEEQGTKLIGQVKDSATNLIDKVKDSTSDIIDEAREELKSKQARGNAGGSGS